MPTGPAPAQAVFDSWYHLVYTGVMKARMNVNLSREQMNRLKAESTKTGAPVAELVRRAIDKAYPARKK